MGALFVGLSALAAFGAARPVPAVAQEGRSGGAPPTGAQARAAFERLVALAGVRQVLSTDAASGNIVFEDARFEYRVTGGGSVLTELANAGTPDEMLSVFFLDGDTLILQHYCSAPNQPRLQLVRADSARIDFDLVGGTGFDPDTDGHIHNVRFDFHPDGSVESVWTWFQAGRPTHTNRRVIRASHRNLPSETAHSRPPPARTRQPRAGIARLADRAR